jgi:hypothetical protein
MDEDEAGILTCSRIESLLSVLMPCASSVHTITETLEALEVRVIEMVNIHSSAALILFFYSIVNSDHFRRLISEHVLRLFFLYFFFIFWLLQRRVLTGTFVQLSMYIVFLR